MQPLDKPKKITSAVYCFLKATHFYATVYIFLFLLSCFGWFFASSGRAFLLLVRFKTHLLLGHTQLVNDKLGLC